MKSKYFYLSKKDALGIRDLFQEKDEFSKSKKDYNTFVKSYIGSFTSKEIVDLKKLFNGIKKI